MSSIDITVRSSYGTYTATGGGKRASSTAGEQQAALALANKFFPTTSFYMARLNTGLGVADHNKTFWRIHSLKAKPARIVKGGAQ